VSGKTCDGTTSSTATPTITSGVLVAGDTAAFTETYDTRNVGTGKTLTAAGVQAQVNAAGASLVGSCLGTGQTDLVVTGTTVILGSRF
jgi:hypothetical protein